MPLDRRHFLQLATGAAAASRLRAAPLPASPGLLRVPAYQDVSVTGGIPAEQAKTAQAVLATLDDDALLKPFRVMGGLPAPGRSIGGWYEYLPDYNWHTGDAGLAPGHCFGQWTAAMARFAATQGDSAAAKRVLRLQEGLALAITPDFFDKTRYPAYTYDKLNLGLLDAHHLLRSPDALAIADKVRQCARTQLPDAAYERDIVWRKGRDFSYTWDESYTISENLYLLYEAGAGSLYRDMAHTYLFKSFFSSLASGQNVLGGIHGYSHVNAFGSAVQAYLVDGSRQDLQAALNGYRMTEAQSYSTGGFAPDEIFVKQGSGGLLTSLTSTHNTFETPCCTYAQLKISRQLLQITRDGHYGDVAERVLFNSMFGALPLQPDGRAFYYADLNEHAQRVYSTHRWPCCAGTYTLVAADYGVHSYLLDDGPEGGPWVIQYLPSQLRFCSGSAHCSLTQAGDYPLADTIEMHLQTDGTTTFPLRLRIPGWCSAAEIRVNGKPHRADVVRGFATLRRTWRDGDRISLTLPKTYRLEDLPAAGGPATRMAALCWGPLVLFPDQPGTISAAMLPRLQRLASTEWQLSNGDTPLRFRPFFALGESAYTTYLHLA